MSNVSIQKVEEASKKNLPIFEEISRRFEKVRRRAFDLFEKRGCEIGHAWDDWLKAEHEIFGWPAAEMTEKDKAYELQVALPGFEANDVQVTATPSEIIVHASVKEERKSEEGNVLWTEFGSNDVYRQFGIPNPIDVDKVTAKLEKGILRITAPKTVAKEKPLTLAAA